MKNTYGMPEMEKQVKEQLEKAYLALNAASHDMYIVDAAEAAKISEVRKQVLDLINEINL